MARPLRWLPLSQERCRLDMVGTLEQYGSMYSWGEVVFGLCVCVTTKRESSGGCKAYVAVASLWDGFGPRWTLDGSRLAVLTGRRGVSRPGLYS